MNNSISRDLGIAIAGGATGPIIEMVLKTVFPKPQPAAVILPSSESGGTGITSIGLILGLFISIVIFSVRRF